MKLFGRSKLPKISVDIIEGNNVVIKKKCPYDGYTLIIEKPKRRSGQSGWTPVFSKDSILHYPKRFGKVQQKLIVRRNAERCLEFREDGEAIPSWDKYAVRRFVQAEVATKLGNVKIKHELPIVFWLLMALSFLNIVLTFMLLKGMRLV